MRKSLVSVALGMALLSISAAHAQGYVGLGAGWANISVDCGDTDQCDKSNTGGKVYLGYRFASQWAVEAFYMDWGKATATMTDQITYTPGREVPLDSKPIATTYDAKLRATGLGIGVAYLMPFSLTWNGVARLGAIYNDGKVTATGSAKGFSVTEGSSKKAAAAYFGLGVGYNVTPNLAITGEADFSRVKYGFEGEHETDNVRLLSLGLRYSF